MSSEEEDQDLDPRSEFNRVVKSFVKDTNNNCIKDAESAVAAKAREQHEAIRTLSASDSPPPTPSIVTTDSTSNKEGGGGGEDLLGDQSPQPQTYDEAMNQLSKLKSMRDSLLEEQKRNNAFVERYKAKVDKQERMAQLHNLIPRQLFVREDRYNDELEKVYKWSGISDQEIADFYNRKLGNNSTKFKHHGAASTERDPYQNFREVPDFSKAVNGKPVSSSYSTSTNSVLRDLEFMRRIAGNGNNQ